jgi:hypothetical protein
MAVVFVCDGGDVKPLYGATGCDKRLSDDPKNTCSDLQDRPVSRSKDNKHKHKHAGCKTFNKSGPELLARKRCKQLPGADCQIVARPWPDRF